MMINLPHVTDIPLTGTQLADASLYDAKIIDAMMVSESNIALLADMVFDEIISSPQFPSLSRSREALIRQASLLVSQKLSDLTLDDGEDNDDIAFGRSDCEFIFRD
jgi:hypothetical protein